MVEGQTFKIFGDGRQFRDFNFVDDVVLALLLAAASESANGKIYNLGAPEAINLLDLAKLLVELHGRGSYEIVPFPPDRRRIDIGDYQGDFSKIERDLGWTPQVTLREGLAQSLAYYERHLKHYL
jgi:nucleoside-diphosphate-sugar epimerase